MNQWQQGMAIEQTLAKQESKMKPLLQGMFVEEALAKQESKISKLFLVMQMEPNCDISTSRVLLRLTTRAINRTHAVGTHLRNFRHRNFRKKKNRTKSPQAT
jgi:hypothetical protein